MAGFLPQLLHRPAWQRQLIALVVFFIAVGLRLVLLPVDGTLAFLTFYPAAVLSFVLLGIGPGWLVVGLCAVAGNVFFTTPLGSPGLSMPGLLSMAMYLLSCGLMAWAVARHHHLARQLALAQAQLQVRGVALTEGERFLQKLTDHLPVRFAYCDVEGRYRFINLAHCHRFKLPRAQVLGSTRAELIGAGPADPVTPRVAAALRGQPQRFEYDDLVDGEHRRLESIMVPDLDASGQVVGFFTSGIDITERVAAQRALSESEALLRRTGHVAGVGGWQLDLRTREVVWSQQMRAILEVEPDFAPTFEGIKAFYAPGVQATVEAAINNSIRHGAPWHLELPMRTAKGRAIRVLAVGEVEFEGGRPARLLGALQDVSKQHALEAELAKTAARATDLYENAPCGYYSVDAAGAFVRVNELTLSWLGCTREQVIGQLGPTDFFSESGRHFYRLMSPVFVAEGRIDPIEFELRSRDGTVRWVSVSATAIRDADGRFVMSRSVMYDVTETHQARSALRSLSAEQTAMLDNDLVAMVKRRERRAVWKNKALERLVRLQP